MEAADIGDVVLDPLLEKARREGTSVDWRTVPVGQKLRMAHHTRIYTVVEKDDTKLMLFTEGRGTAPLYASLANFCFLHGTILLVKDGDDAATQ